MSLNTSSNNQFQAHVHVVQVDFPSDDESVGTAVLAWRTECWCDYLETPSEEAKDDFSEVRGLAYHRLDVLMRYLTDSAASPLMKAFVESDSAIACDLSYSMETFREGYLQIWVHGVDADMMDQVVPLFLKTIDEEVLSEGAFDMERMEGVLLLKRREFLSRMEDSPAADLANC